MRALLLAGITAFGLLDASASQAAVIQLSGVWSGTEAIQGNMRLDRNTTASQAGTQKTFPGTVSDNPTYFSVSQLSVIAGTVVTVTESANNATYSFFSLYDASFSPLNLAAGYLGDPGLSGASHVFSVLAPASGQIEVVANSVGGTAAIGQIYSASVDFSPAATTVPEPATLTLLGLGVAGVAAVRRRQAA